MHCKLRNKLPHTHTYVIGYSFKHHLIILLATLCLCLNQIYLVPVQYRLKNLLIVDGASSVDDHKQVGNEDREGQFQTLVQKELLCKFCVQGLDVLDADPLLLSFKVVNDYLLGVV